MKLLDFTGIKALIVINAIEFIDKVEPVMKFTGQSIIGIMTIILLYYRIKKIRKK